MTAASSDVVVPDIRGLVRLATNGDHAAYTRIVEHYKGSLYGAALRILKRPADAEDAVQEAFIKAYVHLDSYDERYSFYTWIVTILNNVCYSTLRARDWHVAPMPDTLLHVIRVVDRRDEPEMAALLKSRDEVLESAIHTLPEKYSRVLTLRYWSDLSYQEVADATGLTLATVKTQIHRATLLLREALAGTYGELRPEGA